MGKEPSQGATACPSPCPHRLPARDRFPGRRYNQQMNSFASVHNGVAMHTRIKALGPTSEVLLKQGPNPCARRDEAITQHKSFNCCRSGDFPGDSHFLTAWTSL